ncbi:MAG: adenylosuccinate synthetase [Planctomycetota bacterium]
MNGKIVLLSGHVCAGKTSLASALADTYPSVRHLKTREILLELFPELERSREAMQAKGESLDRSTRGEWVRSGLAKLMQKQSESDSTTYIIDAVRIKSQIEHVRNSFGSRVVHIHLKAPVEELARRYNRRKKKQEFKEFGTYEEVRANKTEAKVRILEKLADIVIDSKRCTIADIVIRAACHIGLYARDTRRLVDVLVGGQFGSEGKGQIAAHVASDYDMLVRVGGPNAGHTVLHDGEKAVFHHLPSGTVKGDMPLVIGPGAVLRPSSLLEEIGRFAIEFDRLSIDPQAMIITDCDIQNEHGLTNRISSTGQGVGSATGRKIIDRGSNNVILAKDMRELKPFIRDTCTILDNAFRDGKRILLEGTQGTGLSLHHGPYPHVTSRDTTVAGCLAEAGIWPNRADRVIMACRTYPIRVADPKGRGKSSGPLKQISWKEVATRSDIDESELRRSERTTTTKRPRRVGEFDWALLRKAASLNAPTDVALTFVDYIDVKNRKASRFDQLASQTIRFIEEIERITAAPV